MKYIIQFSFWSNVLIILSIFSPITIFAHLPGQPPFLQINGNYTNFYPVLSSSLLDFSLPQDSAPGNYIVNNNIHFSIDTTKLIVPQYIIKQSMFYWDFGDGQKGQGLIVDHTYNKTGPYLLSFYVNDGTSPENQLLDSVLINILPNKNYILPTAIITVNGKLVGDPLTDILAIPLSPNDNVIFSAEKSKVGSSPILSYFWDLGDGNVSNTKTTNHIYDLASKKQNIVFPLLRVKDKNGFYSDTYVQITNVTNKNTNIPINNTPKIENQQKYLWLYLIVTIISGLVIAIVVIVFFLRKKK